MSNDNLKLWDGMREVDRNFTKPITGKTYKGDSPNPTYIIRKITDQLGPIGQRWGFTVVNESVHLGQPHQVTVEQTTVMQDTPDANGNPRAKSKTTRYEIIREEMHQINIRFWFLDEADNKNCFDAIGGTKLLYMSKSGNWVHDEDAAKKSLTDAYTKGASWLGACADIFLGLFDDKYSGVDESIPARTGQSEPAFTPPNAGLSDDQPQPKTPDPQRNNSAPDGW